jgi:uncharacterized membrane protein
MVRLYVLWAFAKWCFFKLFGGVIEFVLDLHRDYRRYLARYTFQALLAWVALTLIAILISALTAIMIATEKDLIREYISLSMHVTGYVSLAYLISTGISIAYEKFTHERAELIRILKE